MTDLSGHTPLILFDGVCNLCTQTVLFIIRRDAEKRFKFAAMQSPVGQELLKRLELPHEDFKTFVLIEEGRHYVKSAAALRVARGLKGLWPLLYVFMLVPGPIRDFVYDRVARNRYRLFGRRETCLAPSADLKDRFPFPDSSL